MNIIFIFVGVAAALAMLLAVFWHRSHPMLVDALDRFERIAGRRVEEGCFPQLPPDTAPTEIVERPAA